MAADNADARIPYADQRKNHILDQLLSSGRVDALAVAQALGVRCSSSLPTSRSATRVISSRPNTPTS